MTTPTTVRQRKPIDCRGAILLPKRVPFVMGILNVTPDSFSDGGSYAELDSACRRAMQMAHEGADIIDIGGESTRPGAHPVSAEEELSRILPVIQSLAGRLPVPMSVDTRRAKVAQAALEAGCHMVNDVSACGDPGMPAVVAQFDAPLTIMHMKGEPRSMQEHPTYEDVVAEVKTFLGERVELLKQHGISDDKIVIDPGIGFGKRFRDNLELLQAIESFHDLGYPILVGASRKRFLGELLDAGPDGRLSGSLAVAAMCHLARVNIIRVHEVKESVGMLRVLDAVEHPEHFSADW